VVGLGAVFALSLRADWVGKHTLFKGAAGPWMRWLGGIPVDRAHAETAVAQLVQEFRGRDRLYLAIAPEGTRRHVGEWKSGFHRLARAANVRMVPVAFDYQRRAIRLLPPVRPTADYVADLAALRALFTPEMARNPGGY